MKASLIDALRNLSEEELYKALYCDCLTGILNRRAFEQTHSEYVALVDLDSLKFINDTQGHRMGDAQLCAMAYRLTGVFGDEDVYRLAGDEFVVRCNSRAALRMKLERLREIFPGFSYGTGYDLREADHNLITEKTQREAQGIRAPRGEVPPWAQQQELLQ